MWQSKQGSRFHSIGVEVINLTIRETVLTGKRNKHVYKVDSLEHKVEKFMCLSVMEKDSILWHKSMGHASHIQLNKVRFVDLLMELPKTKFKIDKIIEACTWGKKVKASLTLNR